MAKLELNRLAFLMEAFSEGTVEFVSRDEQLRSNRYVVTVGNVTIPLTVSDELWESLQCKLRPKN